MGRGYSRLLAAVTVAVLVVIAPPRGLCWDKASEIIHGNARTLERGETMIGILSPLAFGIHDQVTVFTHPALHLLLTPNLWARASLYDSDSAVALEAGYQQSFLAAGDSGMYPGFFQIGVAFSQLLGDTFQLNAALGYVVDFDGPGGEANVGNLYYRLSGDLLVKRQNLLLAEIRGKVSASGGFRIPTGTFLFARQMGRMRIGVGACVGEFLIRTGTDVDPTSLPAYPWFDLWWRF